MKQSDLMAKVSFMEISEWTVGQWKLRENLVSTFGIPVMFILSLEISVDWGCSMYFMWTKVL